MQTYATSPQISPPAAYYSPDHRQPARRTHSPRVDPGYQFQQHHQQFAFSQEEQHQHYPLPYDVSPYMVDENAMLNMADGYDVPLASQDQYRQAAVQVEQPIQQGRQHSYQEVGLETDYLSPSWAPSMLGPEDRIGTVESNESLGGAGLGRHKHSMHDSVTGVHPSPNNFDRHVYFAANSSHDPLAPSDQHNLIITSPSHGNPYEKQARNRLNRFFAWLRLKKAFHWAHPNFFHERALYGWSRPHSFQFPGRFHLATHSDAISANSNSSEDSVMDEDLDSSEQRELLKERSKDATQDLTQTIVTPQKHLDVFRRKMRPWFEDKSLNPNDGRLVNIVVQSTQTIYNANNPTTWRRTYIENVSPYIIRLAYWPLSSAGSLDLNDWTKDDYIFAGIRWLPASIGLLLCMTFPTDAEGQVRNNGFYDAFPYRLWSYMKVHRNIKEPKESYSQGYARRITQYPRQQSTEDQHSKSSTKPAVCMMPWRQQLEARLLEEERAHRGAAHFVRLEDQQPGVGLLKRVLRERKGWPRYLNFINEISEDNRTGLRNIKTWLQEHEQDDTSIKYVFISFTGEHFARRDSAACEEFRRSHQGHGDEDGLCRQCQQVELDHMALHKMARQAATAAGVTAYWTDLNCLSKDNDILKEDVYDICEMVRNADSLVIVLGDPKTICGSQDIAEDDFMNPRNNKVKLLRQWGTRLWCWPEFLLASSQKDIAIYVRGERNRPPWTLSRFEFAATAFDDVDDSLKLLDHYEGNISLTRLEHVTLALRAMLHRIGGTTPFYNGDLSYALMGLLGRRPHIDTSDSALQAFARLSLANDSDRLLERMICMLPKNSEASIKDDRHYWAKENDHWDAMLWDIEPYIQIAGIGHSDSVLIDGAYAATIHWDAFQRVAITTKETWSRLACRGLTRLIPVYFMVGVILISYRSTSAAIPFLLFGIIGALLSPLLIVHIYSGKAWNTQPWLLGFEGHMNIEDIETMIFGFPQHRLTWAPFGSSLSQHRPRRIFLPGECKGIDPTHVLREEIENAAQAEYGEQRVFTLVDTNTMTVMLIRAVRPPIVALLCASEGGMQRAVLCSYHWPSQTLQCETVIRMETRVIEKMSRVNRVAFSFRKWRSDCCTDSTSGRDSSIQVDERSAAEIEREGTVEIDWSSVQRDFFMTEGIINLERKGHGIGGQAV